MNNKEKYKQAMDNIKASQELKRTTMHQIENRKHKRIKNWMPSVAIVALLVVSVVLIHNNKNQSLIIEQEPQQIAKKLDLPTVDNEEKLKEILKDQNDINYYTDSENETLAWEEVKSVNKSDRLEITENLNISNQELSDYSTTNVQVEGVEEADIVKTDGKYIYSVAQHEIAITDIQNASDMKKVASISLIRDDKIIYEPKELYLIDNKLVIIAEVTKLYEEDNAVSKTNSIEKKSFFINNVVKILVYDVENKENVLKIRDVETDGHYVSSRMIESDIYIITNELVAMLGDTYTRPQYIDSYNNYETKKLSYDAIYYFPERESNNYLNIISFNVKDNQEAQIYSFLGSGTTVYASQNNLYIASVKYNFKNNFVANIVNNYDITTEIYKFSIKGQELKYVNMIEVNGTLINQFAMDEDNGYFRIAVNKNANKNDDSENNIYIYDTQMNLVGKLEGLAKGEKIYSVRFMQNRLYLVTFKNIDPLFVIDLKEPQNPTILGELKIPGVSQYLHQYDETHLIGIGINTVEEKGVAKQDGMKISLFDVTDVNNPIEQSTLKIGDRWTNSDIQYNHKALYFDKQNSIIGFPINLIENKKNFRGAIFFNIDLENGISEQARVKDSENRNYLYQIERIIYVNNNTYTISKNKLISLDRKTLEETGTITF